LARSRSGESVAISFFNRDANMMSNLEDLERLLRDRLDAIGPAPRAELLRVLMLPDHERASKIGEFYGDFRTQTFAQLLIDLEESPLLARS
jgi:hypothetical protein